MEPDPGQVIRSLRLALDMSQAEFARAAGWAASTISSWERGRARPSRLAFKTILAFAEERGVRYRPRTPTALVLAPPTGTLGTPTPFKPARPFPTEPHAHPQRPELRPLLYPERTIDPGPHRVGEPPRWSAEASFRLTLGARPTASRLRLRRGLVEVAIAGAAFCAALALRQPIQQWLWPTAPSAGVTPAWSASAAHAPVTSAAVQLPSVTGVAAAAPLPAPADAPSDPPQEQPLVPAVVARLESVIAVGGTGRATFRTANDAVTVTSGEWLGSQQISEIAAEGVTLRDRDGVRRRVTVGQQITFD